MFIFAKILKFALFVSPLPLSATPNTNRTHYIFGTTDNKVKSFKRRLNESSQRFQNHREGTYWGLLLVESACAFTFKVLLSIKLFSIVSPV